ncbi:hypothetical protein BCV00_12210 [Vibrio breoganii]|nr:hypothetical protein BCV00_12210 [Vibrio breoganii]
MVFSSLLPASIEKEFPGSEIDYLCKPYAETVAYLIPDISKVYSIKPYWSKKKQDKGSFFGFFSLFMKLRKEKYDVVLNVSKSWKPTFFCQLFGIRPIIGFDHKINKFILSKSVRSFSKSIPVMESIASLLNPIGIRPTKTSYKLNIESENKFDSAYVVLHPFAGDAKRCAPLSLWMNLAISLKDKVKVVWFGTPEELSILRQELSGRVHDFDFSDLLSNNQFLEAMKLLPNATLFIGHDSGPMHLAASFDTPVLGLFLPGEPKRTFPQGGGRSKVIYKEKPALLSCDEVLEEALIIIGDSMR